MKSFVSAFRALSKISREKEVGLLGSDVFLRVFFYSYAYTYVVLFLKETGSLSVCSLLIVLFERD